MAAQSGRPSFSTVWDVPDRTLPPPRFTPDGGMEMGDIPDPAEPYADLVLSDGWKLFLEVIVMRYVGGLRSALLRNKDLSNDDRNRMMGSLLSLERVLQKSYELANQPVPSWVADIFK